MLNESIFLLSALIDIVFVFYTARQGAHWLFGAIAVNLLLAKLFSVKLITVFGFATNAGNVFYACAFLAMHLLLERRGRREGLRAVWLSAGFVLFFIIMSRLTTQLIGAPLSAEVNGALSILFDVSIRVTLASLLSYVFAQYVNILVYEWLKARTNGKRLWLRSNGANIVAQLVASSIFFSIAFFDLPGPLLVQAILTGWLMKVFVFAMGTPLLYVDAHLERKKQ